MSLNSSGRSCAANSCRRLVPAASLSLGRALPPQDFPLRLGCRWTRTARSCKAKLEAKVASGRFAWQRRSNAFLQCHRGVATWLPVSTLPLCLQSVPRPQPVQVATVAVVSCAAFHVPLDFAPIQFSTVGSGLSHCGQSVRGCRPRQIKLVFALSSGQLEGAIQCLTSYKLEATKATTVCSRTMREDPLASRTVERTTTTRSSLQQSMCRHRPSNWAVLEPSLHA